MKRPFLKPLLLVFFFLQIVRCSTETGSTTKVIEYSDFDLTQEIEPQYLSVKPKLFKISQMTMTDSLLLFADNYDTMLHVFKVNDGEHMGDWILRGRGPNELQSVSNSGFHLIPGGLSVGGSTRIVLLDIDGTEVSIRSTIKMPGSVLPLNYAFLLNDSTVLSSVITPDSRKQFVSYNIHTKEMKDVVDFPDWYSQGFENLGGYMSKGRVAINHNHNRFARAYSFAPEIRIYNSNTFEYKTVRVELPEDVSSVIEDIVAANEGYINSVRYFTDIKSTDKYLYAFLNLKPMVGENREAILPKQILVFDWRGKPVKRIPIEDQSVFNQGYCFAVSPDNKYLFTVDPDVLDKIYYFETKID